VLQRQPRPIAAAQTEAHKYHNFKPRSMALTTGLIAQVNPISDLTDAVSYFIDAATVDPLSAILVVLGQLLFVVAFAVFGYLVLGSLVDFVIPESPGRSPPRRD